MTAFSWSVQELPYCLKVASGTATTMDDAKREAGHYAIQYAQEGPVSYSIKEGRKTVLTITMNLTVQQ